jgi:GTP-binding protein Era
MTASPFRSGTIAILGRPNAGKSTFLNLVLKQKLAIVSPKPQTTRDRLLGVYQDEQCQIAFIDTPGLHVPRHAVSEHMIEQAEEALREANAVLYLVDGSQGVTDEDVLAAERLKTFSGKHILALNKTDLAGEETALAEMEAKIREVFGEQPILRIQAVNGNGVDALMDALRAAIPEGPPVFPEDVITDTTMRQLASELIREQCFLKLQMELPYEVAVEIISFEEKEAPEPIVIKADLFVEKDNQKGIVIGAGGSKLKAIGMAAREEIEKMVGQKVYLELRVKVFHNWRKDPKALQRFGYDSWKRKG